MKNMKKKNRTLILFILLLTVSLGYAILSTQLNILGTTSIGRNTWSVFWANIGDQKGVTPTSAPIISDEDATHPNTIVSFGVTLAKVGDYYEFEVDAVNDGTLDAMLSTITTTVTSNGEPATLPPYVTCSVKYNDGKMPEAKHLLSKKIGNTPTKERFKIRVEYSRNITISQLEEIPNGGLSYNIELGLSYVQADNTAVSRPKDYVQTVTSFITSSGPAFFNDLGITKSQVEKIYTMKTKELPSELQDEVIESWDVSANGNSSIVAYALDTDSNSLYEIYLGATGGVKAPVDCSRLFYAYSNVTYMDLSNLITDDVANMYSMFGYCSSLTSLDLSSFNTNNVTTMTLMFCNCSGLTSLNLSSFDTSSVTTMGNMFSGCSGLTSLNLSNFNTSNVTDMISMFSGCSGLTSLNLSNFNTSNVTNMMSMFYGCSSLTSLDLSSFNTSNVTSMYYMFCNCSGLTSINLSSFNTSNVTNMYYMFSRCSKLTSIDLSNFDMSKVTSTFAMFESCSALKSIVMPNNYTRIEDFMFNHNSSYNQESFTIPKTVTAVGKSHIFYDFGNASFKKFIVEEGSTTLKTVDDVLYTYDGTRLISIPRGKKFTDNTFVVPEGVTFMNELSFSVNTSISSIVLPNSYEIIRYIKANNNDYGFINTGNSLSIAIYRNTSISTYQVKEDNPRYISYEGCIYNKAGTELIAVPFKYSGVLNVKDGTTTIGQEAFWDFENKRNANITEINVPDSVTTIQASQLTTLNKLVDAGVVINIDSNNASYEISNGKIVAK